MVNEKKKSTSWGCIVVAMIIFWPLGIYLLYKALTSNKTAMVENSKILSVLGYIGIAIAVLGFFVSYSEHKLQEVLISIAFFLAIGSWLIYAAKKMRAKGEKYNKYKVIVFNQSNDSIDYIASEMGVAYEQAVQDLQDMIERGYFEGAYINERTRKIILPSFAQQQPNETVNEPKSLTCSNCGATNKATNGRIDECEYCGSPLK